MSKAWQAKLAQQNLPVPIRQFSDPCYHVPHPFGRKSVVEPKSVAQAKLNRGPEVEWCNPGNAPGVVMMRGGVNVLQLYSDRVCSQWRN